MFLACVGGQIFRKHFDLCVENLFLNLNMLDIVCLFALERAVSKNTDGECLDILERVGTPKLNNGKYVGGSKTIGVNDRFEWNGKYNGGILVKS